MPYLRKKQFVNHDRQGGNYAFNQSPPDSANVDIGRPPSIIIIVIMSCRQHGYPWPSLANSPHRSSPLAALQRYIPYPHIAAVCSSWSFWFCPPKCRGPLEYITYELVPASPVMSCMSGYLTWIVFVIVGWWPYSWCLVECCHQDLFNIALNILV